jgi:transcriptional regulator with XRE-family HTH domain
MDVSFGNRLRSQRERQQLSLTVIAERTKIKASLLEALERDDVSHWPTGIFRRSFVRTYAQAIGLDPDVVFKEFLERYPEPAEEDVTAILAAAQEGRRPPTRLGAFLATLGVIPAAKTPVPKARTASSARASAVAHREPEPETQDDFVPVAVQDDPAPLAEGFLAQHGLAMSAAVAEADDREPARITATGPDVPPDPGPCETLPAPAMAYESQPQRAERPAADRELSALAELCSRLARVLQPRDVTSVLEDAARVLRAAGVILWMWDPATRTLRHVLAHGYSSDVLSRLPRVRFDTDNAIADAFRSADTRVVHGSGQATGAVVVPIVTPTGCAGVLALEMQDRGEERECVRAFATILAAQFAMLFGVAPDAEAVAVGA